MGALPKKKRTRARIGNRQASYRLHVPQLTTCSHCHNPKRAHTICNVCGYYNGRGMISKEESKAPTGGG